MSELESLIESKIYQQDDLETQISRLEKELRLAKSSASSHPHAPIGGVIDLTKSRERAGNSASASPAPALLRSKSGASGITVLSSTGTEEWHDAYAGIEGEGTGPGGGRNSAKGVRDDVSEASTGAGSHATQGSAHARYDAGAASKGVEQGEEGGEGEEERCELCEGPHELDKCPVFAGNLDAAPSGMGRRRCADCDVSWYSFLFWIYDISSRGPWGRQVRQR